MATINDLINISELEFDESGYADITPSIIPNTTMRVRSTDGGVSIRNCRITANDGYVLHDKNRDFVETDPNDDDLIIATYRGYTHATASCFATYDFAASQITIDDGSTVTAYGSREFFAIAESAIPENQIFTVGGNTETM